MAESTGLSKNAGRLASLLALVGIALFMGGLFGAPRAMVWVGVVLIALSLAGYMVEELVHRSWRF
jgi:hypothetical protein